MSVARLLRRSSLLLLVASTAAFAQTPPGEWVITAGPEHAEASAQGAELRKRAQALGAQKKFEEALPILEEASRSYPSTEHDCYLSLAYLRSGQITRAQLMWDVGNLRNGARPDWCVSDLPREIATQLRAQQFVPLTLNIQPAESTVEIAGLKLKGIPVLWLKQGTYKAVGRFEDRPEAVAHLLVAAPSTALTMTVTAADTPVVEPKVEVTPPPPLVIESRPNVIEKPVLPPREPPVKWPGWVALGLSSAAVATGGIFHYRASLWRDRANQHPPDSRVFRDSLAEFQAARGLAIGGYAIGAAALGFGIYWLMSHADPEPTPLVSAAP